MAAPCWTYEAAEVFFTERTKQMHSNRIAITIKTARERQGLHPIDATGTRCSDRAYDCGVGQDFSRCNLVHLDRSDMTGSKRGVGPRRISSFAYCERRTAINQIQALPLCNLVPSGAESSSFARLVVSEGRRTSTDGHHPLLPYGSPFLLD